MVQTLTILGSTGSIGVSTLDVIRKHPQRYRVEALCAHTQVDRLFEQCLEFAPRYAVVRDESLADGLRRRLSTTACVTQILSGPDALVHMAELPDVDTVMAAIVGAAGLPPTMAAARAGKKILLANKEALVMAGPVFMQAVRSGGARLLPIDSEHNAIFQSLPADYSGDFEASGVQGILLTASGGPFRKSTTESLATVTPAQACAHPNWVMGRKISVDSATMMNKALEVIEARWLFDLQPRQVRVVIHPQSIIHSMVVCRDRSVLAQLGTPDMRVPIAYGLSWPERIESGAELLDFLALKALTFEEADAARFPGLQLAWTALEAAPGSTAVLNAANEIAVEAFLAGRLRFDRIPAVNAGTLESLSIPAGAAGSLEGLLALDAQARRHATELVARLGV